MEQVQHTRDAVTRGTRMSSVWVRRLISLLAFVALPMSVAVVIPSPAEAGVCSVSNADPGIGKRRFCKITTTRTGASVRGTITWYYKAREGSLALTLSDTLPDSKCAWLRLDTPGGTRWLDACGDGVDKYYDRGINTDTSHYSSGWYRFYLCTGQTAATACTEIWSQKVEQPAP